MENEIRPVKIEMSSTIGKLAGALSKAQGEITGARKNSDNPFFKSKYADLAEVWDACRDSLSANELSVIQLLGGSSTVITILAHSSGEWIRGELELKPQKQDPQGIGSAITYGRRYSLAAIVGVAQIDDDAEKAMDRKQSKTVKPPPELIKKLETAAALGTGELKQYWSSMSQEDRNKASSEMDRIKEIARKAKVDEEKND